MCIRDRDKTYTAIHRSINKSPLREDSERDDRIYGEVPVTLYRSLTGEGPIFRIPIYDDTVSESQKGNLDRVQLLIEIEHFSPTADKLEVRLDGQTLPQPSVRNAADEDPNNPADVDENSWLVWDLSPSQSGEGTHEIGISLINRDDRIRMPLVVNNVEFWITYN